MKIRIKTEKEVEAKTLHVDAGVRYWEDSQVNGIYDLPVGELIPFKDGDRWKPVIDLETGKIIDWPIGTTANIHYKICDDGIYTLKDVDGNTIAEIDGYVPYVMYPKEDGYGDYIIMDINEDGEIADFQQDLRGFVD